MSKSIVCLFAPNKPGFVTYGPHSSLMCSSSASHCMLFRNVYMFEY